MDLSNIWGDIRGSLMWESSLVKYFFLLDRLCFVYIIKVWKIVFLFGMLRLLLVSRWYIFFVGSIKNFWLCIIWIKLFWKIENRYFNLKLVLLFYKIYWMYVLLNFLVSWKFDYDLYLIIDNDNVK